MFTLTPRACAHRTVLAAIALTMGLGLGACADDPSDPSDPNAASASPSSVEPSDASEEAPAGTFTDQKATKGPIKVGLLSSEGGMVDMVDSRVGAEAAVAYANENLGGLGGHEIQLEICKYKEEDPSTATKCANELAQSDVVGVVAQGTGLGAIFVPVISKAGLAYATYSGNSAEEVTTPGSFLWGGGTPSIANAMALTAANDGVKNFTMFVIGTGDVPAQMEAIAGTFFENAGVKVKVTPIPIGTPDASPQVAAGLKDNPEAVAIIGDATTCAAVLKGLETVGTDATRYLIQPCTDPSVAKAVPDAYEGSYLITTAGSTGDDDEGRAYRAIMAKYAPSGAETGAQAPTGYQSMLGFIRTVNDGIGTNEIDADTVKQAIAASTDVPMPLGAGIMMTCDGKSNPLMPAACSAGALVGKFENGTVSVFNVV